MSRSRAIDRRSQSTRDSIGRAFMKLGGMREIERVNVGMLAREAGIARSTFYAHYRGLDDYLARSFARMLESFARGEQSDAILPVRGILAHVVAAGTGAERLVVDRRFPAMMAEGERALGRVIAERLALRVPAIGETDRRSLATILAAGFLSMMRDWVEQGRRVPAEEVARRFEAVAARLANA